MNPMAFLPEIILSAGALLLFVISLGTGRVTWARRAALGTALATWRRACSASESKPFSLTAPIASTRSPSGSSSSSLSAFCLWSS